jgi:hypothetical protein
MSFYARNAGAPVCPKMSMRDKHIARLREMAWFVNCNVLCHVVSDIVVPFFCTCAHDMCDPPFSSLVQSSSEVCVLCIHLSLSLLFKPKSFFHRT